MTRFILFVFCIAFLTLAGGWVKVGMALVALVFALLVGYLAWAGVRLFMGSPRQP